MNKQEVYAFLKEKNLDFDITEHPAVYSMEELAHLPVWLASYGPVPALDRGVTLWQYSESGVVDGIEGPVDLDLWFTKE